ncbi:MAG: DUF4159 domain-containing protein [Chitinispirillaceae bacterium]|jgi:hypothetical protein
MMVLCETTRGKVRPGNFWERYRLIASLLLFLVPPPVFSQCQFTLARLKYGGGGDWYNGPSALPNLAKAVKEQTSIPICDTTTVIAVMDEIFFHYPFIYMTGHGNVHFTPAERVRLRTYLIGGGFLLANDDYGMDTSFRREMRALFPQNPLVAIPANHPIYSSVHKLPGLPKIHEHDGLPAQGFGIFFDNRLVVYYAYSSDIGDGMEDEEVYHDGEKLHRLALEMGVNIVAWFFNPK